MNRIKILVVAVGCLTSAILLSGCGKGDGFERIVVSGTVSYQGKPIDYGTIEFHPDANTQTPVAAALIEDGNFKIERNGGVAVGKYTVAIEAFKSDEATLKVKNPSPFAAMTTPLGAQYIPAKYNTKTEITVTIPSGSSAMTKDFKLD